MEFKPLVIVTVKIKISIGIPLICGFEKCGYNSRISKTLNLPNH